MVVNKTINQQKIYNSVVKIVNNSITPDIILPYNRNVHSRSQGAGFFFRKDGYILTAAHVVVSSTDIWIRIPSQGQQNFKAKLICIYPAFDIAILKIVGFSNDHFLTLGNSDTLHLRETVYTIGYPNNPKYPIVTSGTISGTRDDYIQTDTPVNPGNSGGPLLDSNNKVIGVTSAVIRKSENSSLIIPINIVKRNLDAMMNSSNKIIYKNVLGLLYGNGTDTYKALHKIPSVYKGGIVIKKIVPKSPLSKFAKDGDVIIKLDNGTDTYTFDHYGETDVEWEYGKVPLDHIVKRCQPKQYITITIWSIKNNKIIKKRVKLSTFDELYPIRNILPPLYMPDYEVFGGIVVVDLTLNHLLLEPFKKLHYIVQNHQIYKKHLVITHIFPNSTISEYNTIQAQSLVKSINGTMVSSVKQYRKVMHDVLKNKRNKYIIIKTDTNDTVVLNIRETIDQESKLSKIYKYPISKIIKGL
jgi:S1-C subfamily serine protease